MYAKPLFSPVNLSTITLMFMIEPYVYAERSRSLFGQELLLMRYLEYFTQIIFGGVLGYDHEQAQHFLVLIRIAHASLPP